MQNDAPNSQERLSSDLRAAVFFLGWAGVGWVSMVTSWSLFSGRASGLDPGPALLPIITLVVLTAGSLALAVRPILKFGSIGHLFKSKNNFNWRPLIFLITVAAFPMLMNAVGYVVATITFVFTWSFLLNPKKWSRPRHTLGIAAIAAIVTSLLIYIGFDLVIGSRLP